MDHDGQATEFNEYVRHSYIHLGTVKEWGFNNTMKHFEEQTIKSCIQDGGFNIQLINSTFKVDGYQATITIYLKAKRQ